MPDAREPAEEESPAPTIDAGGDSIPSAGSPTSLTPEQIDAIRRQVRDHVRSFSLTWLPHAKEFRFQKEVKASPWYRHFVKTFGAHPDLSDPTYDYRGAWQAKVLPGGPGEPFPAQFLSPEHPGAWRTYLPPGVTMDQASFVRLVGDPLELALQEFGEAPQPVPTEPTMPVSAPAASATPGTVVPGPVPPNGRAEMPGRTFPIPPRLPSQVPVPPGTRRGQRVPIPLAPETPPVVPIPPNRPDRPSLVPRQPILEER